MALVDLVPWLVPLIFLAMMIVLLIVRLAITHRTAHV